MGQYYKVIILADNMEIIRVWINPASYGSGTKLMEHSYINDNFMNAIEYLISPNGMFYMSRIIWAGDYADAVEPVQVNEDGEEISKTYLGSIECGLFTSEYNYRHTDDCESRHIKRKKPGRSHYANKNLKTMK
jgi:hypothetical protein